MVDTINDKLQYLEQTKQLIKQAIISKGVNVSDQDTFRSYVNKIEAIEQGSGIILYNRPIGVIPYLESLTDKGFNISCNKNEHAKYPFVNAFKGLSNTFASFTGVSSTAPALLTIECDRNYLVNYYVIGGSINDTYSPRDWLLQGSVDGVHWNLLDNYSLTTSFDRKTAIERLIKPYYDYKYYRVVFIEGYYSNVHVKQVQLFGNTQETLTGGLKSILPVITSADDTPEGYTISTSSVYDIGKSSPYFLFSKGAYDNTGSISTSTRWLSGLSPTPEPLPQWVQIELPEATSIQSYLVTRTWWTGFSTTEQNRSAKSFELQGSNDGVVFDTIDSVSGLSAINWDTMKVYRTLESPATYKIYRINVTEIQGASGTYSGVHLSGFDLFSNIQE